MRVHRDVERGKTPLEVQAIYSIPALARVANVTQQTLRRLLDRNGVDVVVAGRSRYVPLSEIQRKIPPLWESIKAAEALRYSLDA
jgi:hypothetical protein